MKYSIGFRFYDTQRMCWVITEITQWKDYRCYPVNKYDWWARYTDSEIDDFVAHMSVLDRLLYL